MSTASNGTSGRSAGRSRRAPRARASGPPCGRARRRRPPRWAAAPCATFSAPPRGASCRAGCARGGSGAAPPRGPSASSSRRMAASLGHVRPRAARSSAPGDDGERGAQVVRDGAQERVAQLLGLDRGGCARRASSASCARSRAEPIEAREGVEQLPLVGVVEARRRPTDTSARTPTRPRDPVQRHEERARGGAACRSRAPAGRWCVPHPLGDAQLLVVRASSVPSSARDDLERAVRRRASRTATFTSNTSRTCRDGGLRGARSRACAAPSSRLTA